MGISSTNWKEKLRSSLINCLPPEVYLKVVPVYFKIFNRSRRNCTHTFSCDNQGRNILYNGNETFYFADHRRLSLYVYPDALNQRRKFLWNKYTTDSCTINKKDVVVEIGANIGEFSQIAAQIASIVYAFEPDPVCYNCLQENIKDAKNIVIIKKGASDENGKKTFYLSTENADSSFIKPNAYSKKMQIQSVRLDTWMETISLTRIDFLKLEAEGAELEVLEGLGNKISKVKKISVDASPERQGKATYHEVNQFLIKNGFQTKLEKYQVFGWK